MERNERKETLIDELNKKLLLSEMQEQLVSVAFNMLSDNQYSAEDAVPVLINFIHNFQITISQNLNRLKS
ncbi:hypothetical protein [Gracilibacillus phocaeensis]|uniref:hypothetical protein n=1 Tax=Gracilibacillus phocaeensis TaxID=2042304 RepID=UPI00103062A8|nr:hypothetical protein [Gracilibacillus phocaeensis]